MSSIKFINGKKYFITKKKWNELTESQKTEFTKQLQFVGDRNPNNYGKHLYQIIEGLNPVDGCHGWVAFGLSKNNFAKST